MKRSTAWSISKQKSTRDKLIAYIRGDYDYKWWTGFFCIHNDMRTPETDREGDALLKYLITERFPN